jgi:arsenite methyltransferase
MNRRNRRLIEACVEAISPEVGTAVADVGFGGGAGLGLLMERVGLTGVVTGVDPSAEARDQAARRFADELDLDRLRIVAGSADALPLETASQSGVITVNTVYFWPDLDRGLRELRRILAPGAPLAIGIGAVSVQRRMDFDSRAQRVIDAGALAGAMSGAGLTRISTATPRGDDGPAVVRGHAPG